MVQPGNHTGSVKSVEMNSIAVLLAMAGDTVDVALNGIDAAAVSAGSMLCLPQWPVPLVSRFEARVVVLDLAMPILKGRQVGAFLCHILNITVQGSRSCQMVSALSCILCHMATCCMWPCKTIPESCMQLGHMQRACAGECTCACGG